MKYNFMRNEKGGIVKLLLLAIAVGGLYAGYYHFQGTPRYALIQFKRAIQFKNAENVEKYFDMNSFISKLAEEISGGADKETLKKQIMYEINWPGEKSTFASVKDWNVFTIPINISDDNDEVATTEPDKGTRVRLEKKGERQWIITSINFSKTRETLK